MALNASDTALTSLLTRNLDKASRENADALAKLSSGQVFTPNDPRPADRALAEGLEFRLRSISASKKNVNDAVSLLQTAESGLAEIGNIVIRMKELNISSASTAVSDQERRFLLLEYEALREEMDRIALTTEFNGIPVLNGNSPYAPEELIFRIDDPYSVDGESYNPDEDVNSVRFSALKAVVATSGGLGLQSVKDLLRDSSEQEGITVQDVEELLQPENDEIFATVYDEATNRLAEQRAVFGALQSRLQRSMDYMDVYQENIAAAKSKIADTDYAEQVARLAHSRILMQASTSLLAQSSINAQNSYSLLAQVIR